jgi:hypothetical protein
VHIVLTRAGRNQLEHMREQQRIAVCNLQLTGDEDQHRRAIHAELDILCKHGNVVSYLPQALNMQEMGATIRMHTAKVSLQPIETYQELIDNVLRTLKLVSFKC